MNPHAFYPAVAEKLLLGNPEIFLEQHHLVHGLVVELLGQVAALLCAEQSAERDGSDAHVHVVQPYGVGDGAVAREYSVTHAVFLVHHEGEPVVQQRAEVLAALGIGERRLDHGRGHGPAVVEPFRLGERLQAHVVSGGVVVFLDGKIAAANEVQPVVDIVGVFFIACHFGGEQQAGVGHTPFVGVYSEISFPEAAVLVDAVGIAQDFAVAVDQFGRSAAVDVVENSVQNFPDLGCRIRPL